MVKLIIPAQNNIIIQALQALQTSITVECCGAVVVCVLSSNVHQRQSYRPCVTLKSCDQSLDCLCHDRVFEENALRCLLKTLSHSSVLWLVS